MRRGSISTFDPFLLETKVKVRMRKRITAHAHLKRGRISREIQKSIARAAWRFLRKKRYHAILRYAENRSIPFSRRFARVTLTHVTGPLIIYLQQISQSELLLEFTLVTKPLPRSWFCPVALAPPQARD